MLRPSSSPSSSHYSSSSSIDSPFLKLPVEIRLKILHYALCSTGKLRDTNDYFGPCSTSFYPHPNNHPSLRRVQSLPNLKEISHPRCSILQVSRQIYEEAMEAFFTRETKFQFPIRFPEDVGPRPLPENISERQRSLMRNIRVPVHLNSGYFFDLAKVEDTKDEWKIWKAGLTGLRHVEVVFELDREMCFEHSTADNADLLLWLMSAWSGVETMSILLAYQPRFDPRGDRFREAIIKSARERMGDETWVHTNLSRAELETIWLEWSP